MDVDKNTGNGFLFETFDSNGLFWAIEQDIIFHNLPEKLRAQQIQRIMKKSAAAFSYTHTARQYIDLYEKMLQRPLVNAEMPVIMAEHPKNIYRIGSQVAAMVLNPNEEKETDKSLPPLLHETGGDAYGPDNPCISPEPLPLNPPT
jgi:hypothetical protein